MCAHRYHFLKFWYPTLVITDKNQEAKESVSVNICKSIFLSVQTKTETPASIIWPKKLQSSVDNNGKCSTYDVF